MIRLEVLGPLRLYRLDQDEIRAVLSQPKRLGVLVYLALAEPPGFRRRDAILGLFWPELPQTAARRALRQTLYFLRQSLGPAALESRGDEEVRLASEVVACDAAEFAAALAGGREEQALGLYRGDLLPSFFVSGASAEFDEWLAATRTRLQTEARDAALALARRGEATGDVPNAIRWAREATRIAPGDELAARILISLLMRAGDRGGAVQAYENLARLLAREAGTEPHRTTRRLIEIESSSPDPAPDPPPPPEAAPTSGTGAVGVRRLSTRAKSRKVAFGIIGLVLACSAGVAVLASRAAAGHPVLAVGAFKASADGSSAAIAQALPDLLSTALAGVEAIEVIDRARLYEIAGSLGRTGRDRGWGSVARSAGARLLVEGELYARAPGVRLDLRLIDLPRGRVEAAFTLDGTDPFALADSAAARLAARLGRAPSRQVAASAGSSLAARRLFEHGLEAYFRPDLEAAVVLFEAALAEDTTFAMAAYYGALARLEAGPQRNDSVGQDRLQRALRWSARLPERERLLIAAGAAELLNDPLSVARADAFVSRYPRDPEGWLLAGRIRTAAGDFPAARDAFAHLVDLDSLVLRIPDPACRFCRALYGLAGAYAAMDSFAPLERVAQTWLRTQPGLIPPRLLLAELYAAWGQSARAVAVLAPLASRVDAPPISSFMRANIAIRAGNLAEADRVLGGVKGGTLGDRLAVLWWQVVCRRAEGRLTEALQAAIDLERIAPEGSIEGEPGVMARAIVLTELGRGRDAARIYDSLRAAPRRSFGPGALARRRAWLGTLAADALARAGDTVSLAVRADTLETDGAQSAYGRDRRLHHHVRGLLALARGQFADAITEFRAAIYSPAVGFTRSNLELGRLLIATGRPIEAAALGRAALHGPLEASNLYVTQTELHELMGDAFAAAGAADSAAAHYAWVARAWERADLPIRRRGARAADYVGTVLRGREGAGPDGFVGTSWNRPAFGVRSDHAAGLNLTLPSAPPAAR